MGNRIINDTVLSYRLLDGERIECKHHKPLDKTLYINGQRECPYCVYEYLRINGIYLKESKMYKGKDGYVEYIDE